MKPKKPRITDTDRLDWMIRKWGSSPWRMQDGSPARSARAAIDAAIRSSRRTEARGKR